MGWYEDVRNKFKNLAPTSQGSNIEHPFISPSIIQ